MAELLAGWGSPLMVPRVQVARLPSPPVCYWPMVLGPWTDTRTIYVIVWMWFYITVWPRGW